MEAQERNQRIRNELEMLSEREYQEFAASLLPNLPKEQVLGVRLPALRRMAANIAKEEFREYLLGARDTSFEEIMLQGMVIGCADLEAEELFDWIDFFLPKIDNWSVCDSFCAGLKKTKRYPREVWNYLQPLFYDHREYYVRFAVVMLLDYYSDSMHARKAFAILEGIKQQAYYVRMAIAWALSIYYKADAKSTWEYLKSSSLDDFTYNKALQKITELRHLGAEEKAEIRAMKRKRIE